MSRAEVLRHIVPYHGEAEFIAEHAARFIAESVLPEAPRGFTIDPRRLVAPVFEPEDFVVSLRGHECLLANPSWELAITAWLKPRFNLLLRPWLYVGGWLRTTYHLDLSFIVRGRGAAIRAGRRNQQQAIYWPHGDQVLRISPLDSAVPETLPADWSAHSLRAQALKRLPHDRGKVRADHAVCLHPATLGETPA